MSFFIQAAGRIPDAIAQVQAVQYSGNTSQFEAARAYILAELEAWPTDEHAAKGVLVEASGHHDQHTRSITLNIRPLLLPKTAPDGVAPE